MFNNLGEVVSEQVAEIRAKDYLKNNKSGFIFYGVRDAYDNSVWYVEPFAFFSILSNTLCYKK